MMNNNAFIYARVSSIGDRQSTDRQVADLTAYAAAASLEVVRVFEEKAIFRLMRTTFENEIDFICRKVAMCENWKSGCCQDQLEPDQCMRALNAVRKLNKRLVLGNSGQNRMLDEEIRVCHDFKNFI